MGESALPIGLLAALALLLVAAGIEDARRRTISNWTNAAVVMLAPAWWWAQGYHLTPDVPVQLLLAGAVMLLFCVAFAANAMGGGDVKLIGALALWLPLQPLMQLLIVMSLAGGVVTLVVLAEHRWRRRETLLEIPYGVAIAFAGLLSLREPILNQLA